MGEALVFAANGIVTAEAKAAFEKAVGLDANNVPARYFLGLAAEQDGNRAQAAATWRALIATAPPDAPWVEFIRSALARVDDGPHPAIAGQAWLKAAAQAAARTKTRSQQLRKWTRSNARP